MSEATSSLYFYMAGDERRGPFSSEQLRQQPVHRQTPVWCKGMTDWQLAEDLPELAGLIPPAPPVTPHATAATNGDVNLRRCSAGLSRLNRGLLALIFATLLLSTLNGHAFAVVYVLAAVGWAAVLWQAATTARVRWPWLWAVLGVLPLVSYVLLLVLHNRLKRPLTAAGYRISFLGRSTPPERVPA